MFAMPEIRSELSCMAATSARQRVDRGDCLSIGPTGADAREKTSLVDTLSSAIALLAG
jgi:hypothetical protein